MAIETIPDYPERLTELERFDKLLEQIRPLLKPADYVMMGSRQTPELHLAYPRRTERAQFSTFEPKEPDSPYSRSILASHKILKDHRLYDLRRSRLDPTTPEFNPDQIDKLCLFEDLVNQYWKKVNTLTPREIEKYGFVAPDLLLPGL